MKVKTGKTYNVKHSRKGEFVMQITEHNEEWATGTIIEGQANAMLDYNKKYKGESLTVRISFCSFEEVKHG